MLTHTPNHDEAINAFDRAIALFPRYVEAYDLKAEKLAELQRYDEAKAAATAEIFADEPPFVLQGRAAWVECSADGTMWPAGR